MKLDGLINNLRVLWRADKIIADIQLRHLMVRSGVNAFAALIAAFGLLFLETAAYFALIQVWSAVAAAAVLGAANLVIAAVLAFIAARQRPNRELDLAREVHKNAIEALQMNAQSVQDRFSYVSKLDAILPALIVPLAGLLIRSLKKHKAPVEKA